MIRRYETWTGYGELLGAGLFVLSIAGLLWLLNQSSSVEEEEPCGEIVMVEPDTYFDYASFGFNHPQFNDDAELDKGGMPVVPDYDPSTGELPQSRPEGFMTLMPFPLPGLGYGYGSDYGYHDTVRRVSKPHACARPVPVPGTLWLVGIGAMWWLIGAGRDRA